MPKGASSYLTGGDMRAFKCPCENTTRTFMSHKHFDMFVRLHKKKCEILRTQESVSHFTRDNMGECLGLRQELNKKIKELID